MSELGFQLPTVSVLKYRIVLKRYVSKVLWHGAERDVFVLQAEGGPLIGMSLLYRSRLILDVVTDGDVTIDALP